jgi:hypothetical protein
VPVLLTANGEMEDEKRELFSVRTTGR